jgi:membrane protein
VPDNIARPVLRALTQFAQQARSMGSIGLLLFAVTAVAMMLTIDRTLNAIWRVRKPRPLSQRVLVYWAALTLGPLVLGVSLWTTSWAVSASRGIVERLPGGVSLLFDALEFGLLAAAMAGLFRTVPNTYVRWSHAWAGALFVAVGIDGAKRALAWYVDAAGTFSAVYGAFATVPILLLWVFLGWVIVLLGAVIAAYAPSVKAGLQGAEDSAGYRFELALAMLRELQRARAGQRHGLALEQLAAALRREPLLIESLLWTLVELDLVGRLDEEGAQRWVLLADAERTSAGPLIDALLLAPNPGTRAFRDAAAWSSMKLGALLRD